MSQLRWDQRFFATTRGQVVALLRRANRTVSELAQTLGLTDNAVRAHLATLERDGLVRQSGVRRGVSKPSNAYQLTPEAEVLFPKAYGPVLAPLLEVLGERLGPEELERVLRETGRRLSAGIALVPDADPRARLEAAATLLGQLGGLAEVEERDDTLYIQGYSCPLPALAPNHPEVCLLAETLLSEVTGLPIRQCCDRGDPPRCCFALAEEGSAQGNPVSSTA